MIRLIAIIAGLGLSGCAMSAGGLAQSKLDDSFTSTKAPSEFAVCLNDSLNGNVQTMQASADHWVLLRINGYQKPYARWDVRKTPTGSSIEFRASLGVTPGNDKARDCA